MHAMIEQTDDSTVSDGFGITLTGKMRHAILWKARQKFGSNAAFAKHLGIGQSYLGLLINLKARPKRSNVNLEKKLLDVTGCLLEDLFPSLVYSQDFLDQTKTFEHTRYVDPCWLAQAGALSLPPAPDTYAEQGEMSGAIQDALESLTVVQARVVRKRFGIGGEEPMTLEEIAGSLDLTKERVRQIEAYAFIRLRHSKRARPLQSAFTGLLPKKLEAREQRIASKAKRARKFCSHDTLGTTETSKQSATA